MKKLFCIASAFIFFFTFSVSSFASDNSTTVPEAIQDLTDIIGYIPQVQNKNIQSFSRYITSNDLTVENYTFNNGLNGVKVNGFNQNNYDVYFYTPLMHINPGQTYTIKYRYCFGLYNSANVQIYVSPFLNDGSIDSYNTIDYVNTTQNTIVNGSYSFKIDRTDNLNASSAGNCRLVIKISKISSSAFYFAFDVSDIFGIDREIASALYKTGMNTQDILATIADLQEDLIPLLTQWHYDSNQNQINIAQRLTYIYSLLKDEFYDFEQEYGENFTILIYEAICEALGIDEEPATFETDTAFDNAADDYSSAEAAVMPDKDQAASDMDAALSGAGADNLLSNNGAFGFIRDTLNSIVFQNTKLTMYVTFAIAMGVVVLVLGRKIHV